MHKHELLFTIDGDAICRDIECGFRIPADKVKDILVSHAALETAAREAIPYLRNCAEHHRDDSVLEDKIIPNLVALLPTRPAAGDK